MKHNLLHHAFGFVATALLALATGPVAAQSNGPYYATPSWDQTLPGSTRFIVLSNMNSQAVLDRETGLVWQRTLITPSANEWGLISAFCSAESAGGRFGWRLPTLNELTSLFDPAAEGTNVNPPLPAGHPFQIPAATLAQSIFFWTATPGQVSGHWAFGYSLSPFSPGVGFGAASNADSASRFGLCVRGGVLSTPQ